MGKSTLAVAILTLNEELDLPGCISSVLELNCPIFVVDSKSTDRTQIITREMHANIIEFIWDGKYPKKKQWTINKLQNEFEWILLLDADERVSKELQDEITAFLKLERKIQKVSACEADIDYVFQGRLLKHGLRPVKQILLKANSVSFPIIDDLQVSKMWEVEGHYQPLNHGKVYRLKNSLLHNDTGGLFDYIARHNRYSDWEAYLMNHPDSRIQVMTKKSFGVQLFGRLPLKGITIFIYSYLFKLGFLDGRPGFNFAVHRMFYYWQIRAKALLNDY